MQKYPKPSDEDRDTKILTCSKKGCDHPSELHIMIQGPVEYVGMEMVSCYDHFTELMKSFEIIDIHGWADSCVHECHFNTDYPTPSDADQKMLRQQMETSLKRHLN